MPGSALESILVESRPAAGDAVAPAPLWVTTATRGKGKIKPRKLALARGQQPWVPQLTSISHSDAEHGEQEDDPRPRYPPSMVEGWVDYVSLDTPQAVYRALTSLWEHRPVLLRGAPLAAGLAGGLGFRALAQAAADAAAAVQAEGDGRVEVLCSDAARHRFFECDDAKNSPASPYRVREPETQRLRMGLVEFVQCAQGWTSRRVMLKATVLRHRPAGERPLDVPDEEGPTPAEADCPAVAPGPAGAALGAALRRGLDWAWLAGLRRAQRLGPVLRVDLEAGTAGGLQPARYSSREALLVQVAGRRRVLLVPPRWAFAGMYPFPVAHPYDRYSMVDLEAGPGAGAGADEWPRAGEPRGVAGVLRPGDALYVPPYWFAHVQELEPESVALRIVLASGSRPPAADSAPLRAARALEARVADAEGPARVRRWLRVVARGGEAEALDLGTVAGYRRVVMCQGLREEVDETVGPGAWAALLPAVCAGRLAPTPWLAAGGGRDPLLLGDRPVVVEDARSEEERRFPQLFRRKLEAEGWAVPPPVSTLPIPGVNMPAGADYRLL